MTATGAPERVCTGCLRVTDPLDGVQTGADFECGPCFINRERDES